MTLPNSTRKMSTRAERPSSPSSGGTWLTLVIVNDLFFDYERGEKLGLWVLAIDSGLLHGPTCMSPFS